jgi:hypothetical protein
VAVLYTDRGTRQCCCFSRCPALGRQRQRQGQRPRQCVRPLLMTRPSIEADEHFSCQFHSYGKWADFSGREGNRCDGRGPITRRTGDTTHCDVAWPPAKSIVGRSHQWVSDGLLLVLTDREHLTVDHWGRKSNGIANLLIIFWWSGQPWSKFPCYGDKVLDLEFHVLPPFQIVSHFKKLGESKHLKLVLCHFGFFFLNTMTKIKFRLCYLFQIDFAIFSCIFARLPFVLHLINV